MRISIVVPVYNVSAYIVRCLNSVMSQTYPNIECIVVDDCGSDDSMEIVRRTIAVYSGPIQFKVVHHEKNRGLSAARNTGTDMATGDYVYYLDSDDLLLPDSIELLVKPLVNGPLDVVIGNYASGGESMIYEPLNSPFEVTHSSADILHSYLKGQWYVMAWNKMLRREFLLQNNIRFVEGLLHEDHPHSFEIACSANSMGVVRAITYVYVLRPGSIISMKGEKHLDAWIRISDRLEATAAWRGVAEIPAVAAFLTHLRELLADRARPYGRKTAFDVYRHHVRHRSSFNASMHGLPLSEKLKHAHHCLPPHIGYLYYEMAIRMLGRMSTLLKRRSE